MDFYHELCSAIAYICILYKDTFSVYYILYIVFCIQFYGAYCVPPLLFSVPPPCENFINIQKVALFPEVL